MGSKKKQTSSFGTVALQLLNKAACGFDALCMKAWRSLRKISKRQWLKWIRYTMRVASMAAAAFGTLSAVSSASTTGMAIGAAGVTGTYATSGAASGAKSCEIIRHVSPNTTERSKASSLHYKLSMAKNKDEVTDSQGTVSRGQGPGIRMQSMQTSGMTGSFRRG